MKLQHLIEFFFINRSHLFDPNFYLDNYAPDIPAGTNPLMHYIKIGWREGKDPSPDFDTCFYLKRNPDVRTNNVNPLFHYIRHGYEEGRSPQPTQEKTYPRYQKWVEKYDTLTNKDIHTVEIAGVNLVSQPNFLIFILGDNPKEFLLRKTIDSLKQQTYQNFRVSVFNKQFDSISINEKYWHESRIDFREYPLKSDISQTLNTKLRASDSQYFCLVKAGIVFRPHAFFLLAQTIKNHPDAKVIYSDEDAVNEDEQREDPYFKPDWNPDLLRSQYYFNNLCFLNRQISIAVGGFRPDFADHMTWDLALRITETVEPDQIHHIPFVLTHEMIWTGHDHTLLNADANDPIYQKMILSHYARTRTKAKIIREGEPSSRISVALPEPLPVVSVIIPTKNNYQLLSKCLESVLHSGGYKNLEIVIVDNGSDDPKTLGYLAKLNRKNGYKTLNYDKDFNYSAINNYASNSAKGDILLFLNNDIEAISPDWISEMVRYAARPSIGAVGAMLYYPNNTIQHAGIILGVKGVAAHAYQHELSDYQGQKQRVSLPQNYSAVTGACLMIEKKKFFEVNAFNEKFLPVGYNDVDLCLKLLKAGYLNMWTPHAELYHHESASRGLDTTPEKKTRLEFEKNYMVKTWGLLLLNDPAYNPNLSLDRSDFSLAFPPRTNKPW